MKSILISIGVILILGGIVGLAYPGFSYNKEEKIAQIGEVTVTAEHPKRIYVPPFVSVLCIFSGLVLVVVARK